MKIAYILPGLDKNGGAERIITDKANFFTERFAYDVYTNHRREWNKMIDRAMAVDFSWKVSALKYQEMYDWLIG